MFWIHFIGSIVATANICAALLLHKSHWRWHSAIGWALVASNEIIQIAEQLV